MTFQAYLDSIKAVRGEWQRRLTREQTKAYDLFPKEVDQKVEDYMNRDKYIEKKVTID